MIELINNNNNNKQICKARNDGGWSLFAVCSFDVCQLWNSVVINDHLQGAYNSGKHGNLRELVNSGKFRENSGNLKFTQGIYQMLLIVI